MIVPILWHVNTNKQVLNINIYHQKY